MAIVTIEWLVPNSLNPNLTYSINVYKSTTFEDDVYNQIDSISAGPSNSTNTYVDGNGDPSFFYLVRYVPSGGVEGSNVLARVQPSVREQRLRDKIYGMLPEVIQIRIDGNRTQIRDALRSSLGMVNAYAPVTDYTITNIPQSYETAIEFGAQMLLYLEGLLQISIRDFGYGVSGISLNIDRGAKINQALTMLTAYWNDYMKYAKFRDYPDAIGLGSLAIATPQARVFGMLFSSLQG